MHKNQTYNDFDRVFLQRLQATKVDIPRGFYFVNKTSITYTPGIPISILQNVMVGNPVVNLSVNLGWLRKQLEEGNYASHRRDKRVVEQYMATHDAHKVHTLESTDDSDRFDSPFWNLRLDSAKSRHSCLIQ